MRAACFSPARGQAPRQVAAAALVGFVQVLGLGVSPQNQVHRHHPFVP
jgi:hypothetical protein